MNSREFHSWPFREAEKILRNRQFSGKTGDIILATGYGPSGLPHMGTFGEVFRTHVLKCALKKLSPESNVRIFAISDDMDGLRKVPENVPDREEMQKHIGKPVSRIPSPFGTNESYSSYMNNMLRSFLDEFKFEYEFISCAELYCSGFFDQMLIDVLHNYEAVKNAAISDFGDERKSNYSPFLPICPKTGRTLQAEVTEIFPDEGKITYINESGESVTTEVTKGKCKLQWKVDWGSRWKVFGIDFEFHGKDLTPSAAIAKAVCKALGGTPPELFPYELFLDKNGKKISKSKGNGISMQEWLKYSPKEGLALFIFKNPERAKKLDFASIPKIMDEYSSLCEKYFSGEEDPDNHIWHIHSGSPPEDRKNVISYSTVLNIAAACNIEDIFVLSEFVQKCYNNKILNEFDIEIVNHAFQYYKDFMSEAREKIKIDDKSKTILKNLWNDILAGEFEAERIQSLIFEYGKKSGYENDCAGWFTFLYKALFGLTKGPKLGSFFAALGKEKSEAIFSEVTLD